MSSHTPTSRDQAELVRNYHYTKAPTPLSARTQKYSRIVGATGAVLLAIIALRPSAAAPVVSPGRLSAAHAAWENRCDACHAPWEPISRGRPGAALLGRAPGHNDRCDSCHARSEHYTGQSSDENNCASCHAEHRGPDSRLTRPSDAVCVACHKRAHPSHPAVTDFATNHVAFRSPAQFTRQLKFSHAVHLARGAALAGVGQKRAWAIKDIPDAATRERQKVAQKTANVDDLVQLDCAACHQLQSNGTSPTSAPDRSDGRYYAPVRFEIHCRGCHPLTVFDAPNQSRTVPHGTTVDVLRQFIRETYAAEFVNEPLRLLEFASAPPRLDRPLVAEPTAKRAFNARVAAAERTLLKSGKGCARCHLTNGHEEILPVKPKQVWLAKATFSHVAHRATECRVCHAGVYATPGPGAIFAELEAPAIGGIDDCRRCHVPPTTVAGEPQGGAGFACTECHTYHGTTRHRGPADTARDPHLRLGLTDFLRGSPTGGR